jgi:hypothetical protein
MKKYFSLMMMMVAFCIDGALFAQNDLQTIATVKLTKTEAITVAQLKKEIEPLEKASGKKLTVEERADVLDGMINQRLALQAAERDRISVTDNEVNQQISELRAQLAQSAGRQPTDAEFNEAIKQQFGLDVVAFRDRAKKMMIVQKYMLDKKGAGLQSIKEPTNADVEKEYNSMKSEAEGLRMLTQDETMQFHAIVFRFDNDSSKSKARAGADALSKEIAGTVSKFDEKLRQSTQNTEYVGTTNGIIQKNQQAISDVGKDFRDAVFTLTYDAKTGATEISKVLEVASGQARGFYIIKPVAHYPFRSPLALDDIMILYNTTVRNVIKASLAQEAQQSALTRAQEELVAELRKGDPFTINKQYLNY